MEIAVAEPADINELLAVERQCFPDPWTSAMFLSELGNPSCRYQKALSSGRIVGFAGLFRVLDEGYVNNIAVLPAYRGLGIATRLMQSLLQIADEMALSFVSLEVRESNNSAIYLYSKLGFQRIGLRRAYYERPRENALIMTRYRAVDKSAEEE